MKNKIRGVGTAAVALLLLLCALFNSVSGYAIYNEEKLAESCECALSTDEGVKISSRFWELIFGKKEEKSEGLKKQSSSETIMLIPGGTVFGAKIKQERLTLTEACEALGLRGGDEIISVDGKDIYSYEDLKSTLSVCEGRTLTIVFERGSERIVRKIKPEKVGEEYRLGLLMREGAAGIGTITFIDPNTCAFGGLGHGICDPDTSEVVEMTRGEVMGVVLGGVHKGEVGKPGELSGILTDKCEGKVLKNTECGLFGVLNSLPEGEEAIPVGSYSEVYVGKATIISTVKSGLKKEYDIEITEIEKQDTSGTKSFKIKVTDPLLIALTGGIVRGMSGSPIIQNGKLVGAVTHVMVANPTEGYGIFIENMLNAAQSARGELPKAA